MEKKHKWYRGGLAFALCLVLAGGMGSALAQDNPGMPTQEQAPLAASETYPEEPGISLPDLWDWASALEDAITQPQDGASETCTCNQETAMPEADITEEAMQSEYPDKALCDHQFHCAEEEEVYPEYDDPSYDIEEGQPMDVSKLSEVERFALYHAYREMDQLYEDLLSDVKRLSDAAYEQRMDELAALISPLEQKMRTGETGKEDYAADKSEWADDSWHSDNQGIDDGSEAEWYFDYHTGTIVTIESGQQDEESSTITLDDLKSKVEQMKTLLADAGYDEKQQQNFITELKDLTYWIEQLEANNETSKP